jgi:hypothetical protein
VILRSGIDIILNKVEAVKSEESFALTIRQIWRFFRDSQIISPDATLAIIDRVFNQGKKNHFTILGEKDKHKFHMVANKVGDWRPTTDKTEGRQGSAPLVESEMRVKSEHEDKSTSKHEENKESASGMRNPAEISQNVGESYIIEKTDNVKIESSRLDMLDSDSEEDIEEFMELDAENLHDSSKVVLQRQFFEVLVRAAHVAYANRVEFPTLAEKLEDMMKNHLSPLASKNKAKTPEEEKFFKLSEKVYDMLNQEIDELFNSISKKRLQACVWGDRQNYRGGRFDYVL